MNAEIIISVLSFLSAFLALYSISMTFVCIKVNRILNDTKTNQITNDIESVEISGTGSTDSIDSEIKSTSF